MWKKKSSKSVFKTPWMEVVEDEVVDPEGKDGTYSYLSTQAGVSIIALDKKQRIYFVKQYRYPTDAWSWELPGGGSKDTDPLEAAKNELHEELGMEAGEWRLLKKIQAFPGTSDEWQHIYLASELSEKKLEHETDDFPVEIVSLDWSEVTKKILAGEINDAQTLASLMLFKLNL